MMIRIELAFVRFVHVSGSLAGWERQSVSHGLLKYPGGFAFQERIRFIFPGFEGWRRSRLLECRIFFVCLVNYDNHLLAATRCLSFWGLGAGLACYFFKQPEI
jgi:hypothetical protein